jgi:predicted HNH restriction endonuclease
MAKKRNKRGKRNDPNRKRVKEQLFQTYGFVCMVCEKRFKRNELQLHHIIKFEHSRTTTLEDSSLVCDRCHKRINWAERNDKSEYVKTNQKIREYKKGRD